MSKPPRERSGFGPSTRFPRNGVFFAALLVSVFLALNLWSIAPKRTETDLAFVERTLKRAPERGVIERHLAASRALALLLGLMLYGNWYRTGGA